MTLVEYYQGSGRGSPFQVPDEFCFVSFDRLYYLDLRTAQINSHIISLRPKEASEQSEFLAESRADPGLPDLDA